MSQDSSAGAGFTPAGRGHESTLAPVVSAEIGDVPVLAQLIAGEFADLPPSVWLVGEPEMRIEILRAYFALHVEHALAHGHVDMLEDHSAVAVWFHHTAVVPEPDDYPRRLREAVTSWTGRFLAMEQVLHADMPADPLHHLAFLAASTGQRGTGGGTALLRHHLAEADQIGVITYLEAADEPLTGYYQRFGFHRLRPLVLPDGPAFWPMVRSRKATP